MRHRLTCLENNQQLLWNGQPSEEGNMQFECMPRPSLALRALRLHLRPTVMFFHGNDMSARKKNT
jgi:hypothetical protein